MLRKPEWEKEQLLRDGGFLENAPSGVLGYFCCVVRTAENVEIVLSIHSRVTRL